MLCAAHLPMMSTEKDSFMVFFPFSELPQILIILLLSLLAAKPTTAASSEGGGGGEYPFRVAKANCRETCGDVTIPFPFGIGTGCFLDEWYEVVCLNDQKKKKKNANMTTTSSEVPMMKKIGLEVLNISLSLSPNIYSYQVVNSIRVKFPVSYSSPNCTGTDHSAGRQPSVPPSLSGSNFIFSPEMNMFTAVGCGDMALMNSTVSSAATSGRDESSSANSAPVGCTTLCPGGRTSNVAEIQLNDCSGYGCCQAVIPSNLQAFNISFLKVDDGARSASGDGCSYAFLVDRTWLSTDGDAARLIMEYGGYAPVSLEWGVSSDPNGIHINLTDGESSDGSSSYHCSYQSDPYTSSSVNYTYLHCFCNDGYEGNPYLGRQGCQDINECEAYNPCSNCLNTAGSYYCEYGSNSKSIGRVKLTMKVIGGFIGAVVFLLCWRWLYRTVIGRYNARLKQKFFKKNGGLLLQQQLASPGGNMAQNKLFESKELESATDTFNRNRILGQGGQGTVYKGMLADGRIIAVKKSVVPDEAYVQQFINEVSILSQINHRNVVKLLGCCLETEVPLLVYEFIPNGTLYQYLHDPNEELHVPWQVRLRIASEVSGALSYLHSAASTPIYHRDIKTSNILLDEKYQAKIADFGMSKLVALDQSHVTTMVQGTFGYLDPEYFQSSQFTDKSDVYSFGVVLVELLTGQKPINSLRVKEGIGLATYFIISMEEDRLLDIVDARILNPEKKEEIIAVARLAKRCLNVVGRMRPTMKQVASELESVRRPALAHPSSYGQEEFEECCSSFEMDVVEAQDVVFRSEVFGAGNGMSLIVDVNQLMPNRTW